MSAQVSFLDGTLSLIHIPLELYPSLLQPILKVLLPPSQDPRQSRAGSLTIEDHRHGFLNISVTPIECSIVCNSAWAASVFEPAIKRLPESQAKAVTISKDTYIALSVYGSGMDAGSRVADLTSPLALANISIFFITTYYSDFILVPTKDRQAVVETLLARDFVFSDDDGQTNLVCGTSPTTATATTTPTTRHTHAPPPTPQTQPPAPQTTDPATITTLQQRTFTLLQKRHITPYLSPGLTLVQCSGIRGAVTPSHQPSAKPKPNPQARAQQQPRAPAWVDTIDTKLYTSIVTALAAAPRFLSVTLAPDDPPALLVDRGLLGVFGDSLVGPLGVEYDDGALVPIFLDLADLPFEAAGIVSGVAGRLVSEMGVGVVGGGGVELSYLSTARAGAVILGRAGAKVALRVLGRLLDETAAAAAEREKEEGGKGVGG
ncbi:ACT domain-containing protein [Chaetomium tenue]|uniref:ACT domain-containing protein n=1 Tax=Chaetomium tenue TaxID=1854479 RepID=A0ACB7PFF4_9PEZI|nr:ACT domain-containing protein [Chaetomium globosum]